MRTRQEPLWIWISFKVPFSAHVSDIPGWLRSLRLHKYTPLFEHDQWKEFIRLTDEQLQARGVVALGARRKMLKVFEQVRMDLDARVTGFLTS
jgi:hypothetical protein